MHSDEADYENDFWFANKYLSLFIANLNNLKDHREKYTLTDYYEERP